MEGIEQEETQALKYDGETDYTLVGRSCWITVENLSVYVHKTDEGVVVDIYPRFKEDDDDALIAAIYAYYAEAETEEENERADQTDMG